MRKSCEEKNFFFEGTTHPKQVAFVKEQNDANSGEELVGDDTPPEEHRVLESIDARVLKRREESVVGQAV